jgi:branched-chain amino acid transport system permease protein
MNLFLAQLISGLALGSIYVLLATGFNLMLLVARIIQFAYPHFVVLSMYVCWYVLRVTNDNIVLAILAAILFAVFLNIVTQPIFRHLMRRREEETDINITFIVALGMSMVITDVMSHELNEGFAIAFPETWAGREAFLRFGLVTISMGEIFTLVVGIIAVIGFFYLLYRMKLGRSFRAIAEEPHVARLVGIPVTRMGIYSYAIAGLLGGIIAVLLSLLLGSASAGLGEMVALKVLAVAIVAGLGNLLGGLVCGLFLGIAEAMVMGYFPGSWSNAIAFVLMLVIVLAKPHGLFGTRV